MICPCGGKVLTVYIRQGKPLRWVPLGKMCIQCKTWEEEITDIVLPPAPVVVRGTGRVVSTSDRPKLVIEDELGEGIAPPEEQTPGPPLDVQGIPPDSVTPSDPGISNERSEPKRVAWKPPCTCGPGERAKGKHNKKCPARGEA